MTLCKKLTGLCLLLGFVLSSDCSISTNFTTTSHVPRAEISPLQTFDETFDDKVKEEQLLVEKENNLLSHFRFGIIIFVMFVLFLLLIILFWLYYLKQKAYLGLYHQIQEKDLLILELEKMKKQFELLSLSLSQRANEVPVSIASFIQNGNTELLLQQQLLVDRLREYVLTDGNYMNNDIDRDEIISALSSNRTSLSEAVKAVTNKTLMEYINFLRLEEAKRLLGKHNEFTIEAIAEKCGFNLRTFHRLFNEHYHISPAKYRKIHFQKKH